MNKGESPDSGPRRPASSRCSGSPPATGPGRLVRLFPVIACILYMLGPSIRFVQADEELDYGLESHRLARIEITGNEAFTTGELKKLLQIQEATWTRPLHVAKYRPHLVDTQVRLLGTFYRNRGFHQVSARLDSISTIAEEGDVLHISIVEGQRTLIGGVVFEGNGPLTEARLRAVMYLLEGMPERGTQTPDPDPPQGSSPPC